MQKMKKKGASADSLAQLTGAIINVAQQTMTPNNPISSPNDVVIVTPDNEIHIFKKDYYKHDLI